MSLSNYKITDSDVAVKGVVAAPDRLTGTAAENKAIFDRLIREPVKGHYNDLIDKLDELGIEYAVLRPSNSTNMKYIKINSAGALHYSANGTTWKPIATQASGLVTEDTPTTLTGVLTGDGSNVGAATPSSVPASGGTALATTGAAYAAQENAKAAAAQLVAPVEASSTASRAYAVGEYFVFSGVLRRCTAAIAAGGTIAVGTNCVSTSVGEQLGNKCVQLALNHGQTLTITAATVYSFSAILVAFTGQTTSLSGLYYIAKYSNGTVRTLTPIVNASAITTSIDETSITFTNTLTGNSQNTRVSLTVLLDSGANLSWSVA